MHVVNLAISYTLGVKENTKTHKVVLERKKEKVTEIVTPGGAFPDSGRILKTGRKIINFFTGSPQRKDKLNKVIAAYDLPTIAMQNYPDTRVAYSCQLMVTVMANYHALQLVEHDDFPEVMSRLSHEDWRTMQEMEAVYVRLWQIIQWLSLRRQRHSCHP